MKKNIIRVVIIALVVGGLIVLGVSIVKNKRAVLAKAALYKQKPLPVRVAISKSAQFDIELNYFAEVEACQEARLSAQVTAHVTKMLCDEGQIVKQGEVLLILDNQSVKDSISIIDAQITQIETELEGNADNIKTLSASVKYWQGEGARANLLGEKNAISISEVASIHDKLNEVQGRLSAGKIKSKTYLKHILVYKKQKNQLLTRIEYYTIKAPFSGRVAACKVENGDLATPGMPLVFIRNRSKLKLIFDIPQYDLPKVEVGQGVSYKVNGLSKTAKLNRLYPSSTTTQMVTGEIEIEAPKNFRLACGAYIPLSLTIKTLENAITVPASSIVEHDGGKTYVFLIKNNIVEKHEVNVIASKNSMVAVDGIEAGVEVIQSSFLNWARLSTGSRVVVIK